MSLVHVVVEDEFTETGDIVFSDLEYMQSLADHLEGLIRALDGLEKPVTAKQFAVYPDHADRTFFKQMAVSSLQVFVAVNWFGCDYGDQLTRVSEALINFIPDARSYLELTDETFPGLRNLELLALAKFILYKAAGASIWKARYLIIHQIVLSVPSSLLYLELKRVHQQFQGFLTEETTSYKSRLLKIQIGIELSQFFLWYTDVGSSKPLIEAVNDFSGLQISFTGALGKRTRYQVKDTAQLCVQIHRSGNHVNDLSPADPDSADPDGADRKLLQHPHNVALDDDTLLNQVKFSAGGEETHATPVTENEVKLSAEEELLLFATACQIRRMSSFSKEESEELMTLIEYLISRCSIWCIRFESLLIRSQAEKHSNRRSDRSLIQLETLVKQVHQTSKFDMKQNLKFMFAVSMTPKWIVQKYLADVLFQRLQFNQALEVYTSIQNWKGMIHCYHRRGRDDEAEKLIRKQIQSLGETPFLLCLLADVTRDVSYYEKAWLVSDQRYFQAKTSLGDHFFDSKDYAAAIPHYQSSLKLNGLQISTWQRMGFAALSTEDYELAVRSYRRFVEFEADVFEAWNNLAKAYIKLDRKTTAYSTLQEAIKCNYDEWRLWENYLIVSTDVGAFEEVIRSWHRLIDIKGKYEDDGIIEILVTTVIQDIRDMHGNPGSRLGPKLLTLFARIRGTPYSSPRLWLAYARLLHHLKKEATLILDAVRRCNRSISQSGNWGKDEPSVRAGLECLNDSWSILCDICADSDVILSPADRESLSASKLMIESLMKTSLKCVDAWDQTKVDVKQITQLLHELDLKLPGLRIE